MKQRNNEQQTQIDDLQKQLNELKSIVLTRLQLLKNSATIEISSAVLEQNVPNPFNGITSIGYSLPEQYRSAEMRLTDANGRLLKRISLRGSGKNSVEVETPSAGVYFYSLYVNEQLVATKKMMKMK